MVTKLVCFVLDRCHLDKIVRGSCLGRQPIGFVLIVLVTFGQKMPDLGFPICNDMASVGCIFPAAQNLAFGKCLEPHRFEPFLLADVTVVVAL